MFFFCFDDSNDSSLYIMKKNLQDFFEKIFIIPRKIYQKDIILEAIGVILSNFKWFLRDIGMIDKDQDLMSYVSYIKYW